MEVAGEHELHASCRPPVVPCDTHHVLDLLQELPRKHADFVDDQHVQLAHARPVAGRERSAEVATQRRRADAERRVKGLTAEQRRGGAGRRRHGDAAAELGLVAVVAGAQGLEHLPEHKRLTGAGRARQEHVATLGDEPERLGLPLVRFFGHLVSLPPPCGLHPRGVPIVRKFQSVR